MTRDGRADAVNPDRSDGLPAERVILHDLTGQPIGADSPLVTGSAPSSIHMVDWVDGTTYSNTFNMEDQTLIAFALGGQWTQSTLSLQVAVATDGQPLWRRLRLQDSTLLTIADVVAPDAFRLNTLYTRHMGLIRFESGIAQTGAVVTLRRAPS